ncbi:MAG: alpha/beta hydrolase [Promethearchaeota archaeon]
MNSVPLEDVLVPVPNVETSSERSVVLETKLHVPKEPTRFEFTAVICHPHPQFGGDMHNNVVNALFGKLAETRYPVAKFNFRGVGKSTGSYSGGAGEVEDVVAVVRAMVERFEPTGGVVVVGYSFGAVVGASAVSTILAGALGRGCSDDSDGSYGSDVAGFIGVAFPFDLFPVHASHLDFERPKLLVQGTRDQIAHHRNFPGHFSALPPPKLARLVEGADHFFFGHESEVASLVAEFVDTLRVEKGIE